MGDAVLVVPTSSSFSPKLLFRTGLHHLAYTQRQNRFLSSMWMSTSISFTASCQRRPRSSRTTARYVSLFRVCIVFILSFYFHTLCLIFVYPTLAVLMGEDNTAFEGLFGFCSISPGGSIGLSNVRVLSVFGFIAFMLSPYILPPAAADITIDWVGSLQLTRKHEAFWFCYINDIVFGILEFLRTPPHVLYIDVGSLARAPRDRWGHGVLLLQVWGVLSRNRDVGGHGKVLYGHRPARGRDHGRGVRLCDASQLYVVNHNWFL